MIIKKNKISSQRLPLQQTQAAAAKAKAKAAAAKAAAAAAKAAAAAAAMKRGICLLLGFLLGFILY